MATTIKIKNSVTATTTPTSLVQGEVAINVTDKKVWVGNAATTPIQIVGAGTTGNAAGSNTQVQYNSSGSFAGDADFTFNGTTVTMANDASISGLTVGKGGGALSTNTAVGNGALAATNTNGFNVAIGQYAFNANTTGQGGVAIGSGALQNNTTGNNNTATGINSLLYNTTGQYSSAFGTASLQSNTTGSNNVACGYGALQNNTTASDNTAVGYQALYNSNTNDNAAFGQQAATAVTTGVANTAIGRGALLALTTGSYNTAVGNVANNFGTTGSYTVAVGYNTYPNAATDSYCFMIGAAGGTQGKGSNTGVLNVYNGSSFGSIYQGNNSASWATTSDQRLKKNIVDNKIGLDAINAIQVRNFEYRTKDEITELNNKNVIDIKGVQIGVIAQELQAILPDCVKTESSGVMSVDTTNLTWYLINAVKELKAEIDQLKGAK